MVKVSVCSAAAAAAMLGAPSSERRENGDEPAHTITLVELFAGVH